MIRHKKFNGLEKCSDSESQTQVKDYVQDELITYTAYTHTQFLSTGAKMMH